MKKKLVPLGCVGLVVLVFSGCGTPPAPSHAFVRRGPTYIARKPDVERVGLLVDATVSYDRVSTNYIDLEDSRLAITNLLQEAEAGLRAKGYEVAYAESPFIGGFKSGDKPFRVAPTRKDSPELQNAPFFISKDLDSDPDYRDALLRTSRDVLEAVQDRGELPTEVLTAAPTTQSDFAKIKAKRGLRYLVIVQGNGTVVSGGKQVGQSIGTALLSTVVTLGAVTATAHNISLLDNIVSLVDLESPEVVWCNSLRLGGLNPANSSNYKSRWAQNVLYWLPPKGQLELPQSSK